MICVPFWNDTGPPRSMAGLRAHRERRCLICWSTTRPMTLTDMPMTERLVAECAVGWETFWKRSLLARQNAKSSNRWPTRKRMPITGQPMPTCTELSSIQPWPGVSWSKSRNWHDTEIALPSLFWQARPSCAECSRPFIRPINANGDPIRSSWDLPTHEFTNIIHGLDGHPCCSCASWTDHWIQSIPMLATRSISSAQSICQHREHVSCPSSRTRPRNHRRILVSAGFQDKMKIILVLYSKRSCHWRHRPLSGKNPLQMEDEKVIAKFTSSSLWSTCHKHRHKSRCRSIWLHPFFACNWRNFGPMWFVPQRDARPFLEESLTFFLIMPPGPMTRTHANNTWHLSRHLVILLFVMFNMWLLLGESTSFFRQVWNVHKISRQGQRPRQWPPSCTRQPWRCYWLDR